VGDGGGYLGGAGAFASSELAPAGWELVVDWGGPDHSDVCGAILRGELRGAGEGERILSHLLPAGSGQLVGGGGVCGFLRDAVWDAGWVGIDRGARNAKAALMKGAR